MEAVELFLDAFDLRRGTFAARLKICRKQFSEVAVHDLRVAARRLLAFVEIARLLDPGPRPLKVRRQLKSLIDGFDDLRDAQAMLAGLDDHVRDEASLAPLRECLLERERTLLGGARRAARDFEAGELKRRLARLRRRLAERLADAELDVDPFTAVDEAFAAVLQCDSVATIDQPATIHRVRLAFKKFRYRLEVVHQAVPSLPADHLTRLHDFQTTVGRIQDVETFLALLSDFAEQCPDRDFAPARACYLRLQAKDLDTWLAERGALTTFWRPAPARPFPWLRRPPRRKAVAP